MPASLAPLPDLDRRDALRTEVAEDEESLKGWYTRFALIGEGCGQARRLPECE